MTAYVLIGYLAFGVASTGGGPFTAEFSTEEACRAAAAAIMDDSVIKMPNYAIRRAICVPK